MEQDLISAVQAEVARIRDMITTTKELLPNNRVSFSIYEGILAAAERAVREQDTIALVRILPELKEMQ